MEKVCPPHCNTSMYCVYTVRGKTDGWALFDEFLGRAEQNENGWMIHHFTAWRRLSHHLPVEAGHRCDDLATSVHSLIYRSFVVLFLLFLFVPIPSCILRNAQHFGSSNGTNGTGLSLYFVPTFTMEMPGGWRTTFHTIQKRRASEVPRTTQRQVQRGSRCFYKWRKRNGLQISETSGLPGVPNVKTAPARNLGWQFNSRFRFSRLHARKFRILQQFFQ